MKTDLAKVWTQICISISIFIEKAASRKFIAWAVATHMAYAEILDSNSWLTITLLFMSAQTILDWKIKPNVQDALQKADHQI